MNQPLPIRKTQGEQKKQMTSKVNMREEIEKILLHAIGTYDYSQEPKESMEQLLALITKIRITDLKEVKKELGKDRVLANTEIKHYMDTGYNTAKYELRAYLDSKIKELEGVKSGSDK